MVTDNERREVARKLRAVAKKLGPNMDASEFANYTADVLDVDESMTWYEMELRLADLIEPPLQCPYYRSDRHYCSIHDVPTIDRDALLALADDVDSDADNGMGGTFLRYYARRIREALGVEDGR